MVRGVRRLGHDAIGQSFRHRPSATCMRHAGVIRGGYGPLGLVALICKLPAGTPTCILLRQAPDSAFHAATAFHLLLPICGVCICGRSSFSGRYGTTPLPPAFLEVSTMILSVPPNSRSMVSRYMRWRVTSGAFLYWS
jgi:hypothetical protein